MSSTDEEAQRLAILRQYPFAVEGHAPLDRIARLAAQVCGCPTGLVSIVDASEQFFIGKAGLDSCSTPRQWSFCDRAMRGSAAMIIDDASRHPDYRDNPLVTGPPHIRFYAGQPLLSPEGQPLGSLCVIDQVPHEGLTQDQRDGLETLAQLTMAALEQMRTEARNATASALTRNRIAELEQRFEVLADSLPEMVWSTPPNGQSDYFNRPWQQFTGQPAEASYGTGWLNFLHPEDAPVAAQAWSNAVSTGNGYEVRYRLRRHDGEFRWVMARGLPIRDHAARIVRWIGTCSDIEDDIANAATLELLSQELNHRIKNIFAVIGGLVSLSARNHPDADDFARELYDRILALGRAHGFVGNPGARSDLAVHGGLKGMLAELLSPYRDASGRIAITGDEIEIDDRSATPLALIFHELATNSAKYGALSHAQGTIEIALTAADPARLCWTETGIATTGENKSKGFGSKLMDMSIVRQLGGNYSTNWQNGLLEIVIEVPGGNLRRT